MEGVGACARISHVSPRIRERGSPRARDFLPLQCRARFRTRRLARRRLCQSAARATHSPQISLTGRTRRQVRRSARLRTRESDRADRGRRTKASVRRSNGRSSYKRPREATRRLIVESSISTETRRNAAWYASMIVRTEYGRRFTSK